MDSRILEFFTNMPLAIPIYKAVEAYLTSLGPVTRRIHKTQISFRAVYGFAYVWLPVKKVKDRPEQYLVLSFGLDHQVQSPRIVESLEPYPGRWMHHLILAAPEALDEEVREWLRLAYQYGNRPNAKRRLDLNA